MKGIAFRLAAVMVLGLRLAVPAAAGEGESVHALVAEGKRLFAAGQYAQAQEKFAAAEVLAPENLRLAYDRGRAYHAAGDLEKAGEFYRKSAVSANPELNARTWFNQGDLEVLQARAKLGPDPLQAAPEVREEILGHLDRAVERFRSVLEVKAKDPDARYNIEVIRLCAKDLMDRWRKADREKARKDADLLKYLEYLMQQQEGLKRETEILAAGEGESDRPVRLEQTRIVQEELVGEMPHLRDKVKDHLGKLAAPAAAPGGAASAPPDPKRLEALKGAEKQLLGMVDQAEGGMKKAVDALDALEFQNAVSAQEEANDHLFEMWKGLADFTTLLARAIRDEDALIAETEPFAGADSEEETKDEARAATRLQSDQDDVRELVPLLTGRARSMVKQLESMPDQKGAGAKPPAPGQPNPVEMKKAFARALELLPKAEAAMEAAGAALGDRAWPRGLEQEKEAAKTLKEIQKLFKNQQPKQDQDDRKKDDQKQKDDRRDDQKKDDQQKKDPKKKKPEPRKLSPEEAKRLLQKMRENRKKREKKRREAEQGRRIRVEKDW